MQVTPPKTRSQINLCHLVINHGVKNYDFVFNFIPTRMNTADVEKITGQSLNAGNLFGIWLIVTGLQREQHACYQKIDGLGQLTFSFYFCTAIISIPRKSNVKPSTIHSIVILAYY